MVILQPYFSKIYKVDLFVVFFPSNNTNVFFYGIFGKYTYSNTFFYSTARKIYLLHHMFPLLPWKYTTVIPSEPLPSENIFAPHLFYSGKFYYSLLLGEYFLTASSSREKYYRFLL
jgi:hypothetical protein